MSYFDEESRRRFIPHIVETSVGVARMMLAFIDNAFIKEKLIKNNSDGSQSEDERVVLKLDYRLSPIKVAILPLFKKDGMSEKAKEIFNNIRKAYQAEYDESGSIGKRYRRQDEIGTPFCITIDHDTMSNNTITIRNRDDMTQDRIEIIELQNYLREKLGF
ncbi:MAG: His/Gly/Thr/Pro-type tRNA ligase C-terminal domain-containing protein [Candidatus Pacebacteria bacterium]|nr:His/Gly/Thr/Pro-type tRNA ligase C-terminal domain-containing protein [Candidatus Paceibacterota bacterium]